MRSKLRGKLTTTRGLVVICGLVFAVAWAMPAVGASPLKLAKKALSKATMALDTANRANTAANTANSTANEALTKANGIVPGARAFARMDNPCSISTTCVIDHARGITQIRHSDQDGVYCLTAPGLSPSTNSWVASVDAGDTADPGNAQAMPGSVAFCNSGEFMVQTNRGAVNSATVAFYVVIP